MSPILKCDQDDKSRELDFELKYQRSLTVDERFTMMFQKPKEIAEMLIKTGHRNPFETMKQAQACSMKASRVGLMVIGSPATLMADLVSL